MLKLIIGRLNSLGYFSGAKRANFLKDLFRDTLKIQLLGLENFRDVFEIEFFNIFELVGILFLEFLDEELSGILGQS